MIDPIVRLPWSLAPEEADRAIRSRALADWPEKYRRGEAPDASALDRNFRAAIDAGVAPMSDHGAREPAPGFLERLYIHTHAAHYLPEPVYEAFYEAILRSRLVYEIIAATRAREAVGKLRRFPGIDPDPARPRPKPEPETDTDRRLRVEWQASEPVVTRYSPPEQIARVLATFSADDLHELAHGQDLSDAPLVEAVAQHPSCDWGSACEIMSSFGAASYQSFWRDGKPEEAFGPEDRILFRTFATISERARRGQFRSRRFSHGFQVGKAYREDGLRNEDHPAHWVKWSIPDAALHPTSGERHRPSVTFDNGSVRPAFELWKRDRGGEP